MEDIVFLAPGFLGFERFNNFSYFDTRVTAALQSALKILTGRHVPVVALNTRPSAILSLRQAELLASIASYESQFGSAQRIHLLGHSTGGVDVALLLNNAPLAARCWSDIDSADVRGRLRTAIPMAAPQWGTCLTLAPFVRVVRELPLRRPPSGTIAGALSLARLASLAGMSFVRDQFARSALTNVIGDLGEAAAYVKAVVSDLALLDNLRPDDMAQLRAASSRDTTLDVRLASVVTAAGMGMCEHPVRHDALFHTLYAATAGAAADCLLPEDIRHTATARLMAASRDGRLVSRHQTRPEHIDEALNDGIVNSLRQLVLFETETSSKRGVQADELLAFAVADHLDVIGFYPRIISSSSREEAAADGGFLLSGSGWSDAEFYRLYEIIATCIAERAR